MPGSASFTATRTPMAKPYHTHGKDDYGTPGALYGLLDQECHLTLDVCADQWNHKCPAYLTQEMDALSIDWWGRVFMNPPFSLLNQFLAKMIRELVLGHIEIGVALVAARSDTRAMFTASSYAGETRFLKGRVSYEVHPTEDQRDQVATLVGVTIDQASGNVWPQIVKAIGLPKTAIQALLKDPTLPGGSPLLTTCAPFPSTVLVFDRRKAPTTVFWDWKQQLKTVYVFGLPKTVLHKATPEGHMIATPKGLFSQASTPFGSGASKFATSFLPGKKVEIGPTWDQKTVPPVTEAQAHQDMMEALEKPMLGGTVPASYFLNEAGVHKAQGKTQGKTNLGWGEKWPTLEVKTQPTLLPFDAMTTIAQDLVDMEHLLEHPITDPATIKTIQQVHDDLAESLALALSTKGIGVVPLTKETMDAIIEHEDGAGILDFLIEGTKTKVGKVKFLQAPGPPGGKTHVLGPITIPEGYATPNEHEHEHEHEHEAETFDLTDDSDGSQLTGDDTDGT